MRQLLRCTRSTEGLYARYGDVEDGQLALAIWCSQYPEEDREYTHTAAESFMPSFKISESRYQAERGKIAEIKLEEGQRRSDGRCPAIKRERSRQIKKEVVEDEPDIYAVPEEINGGLQSERNIKRKRLESRTRRMKRCTTVQRGRVVKKEVVEGETYQAANEERAASSASKRSIRGKRQTIGEKLPTRTQPARQCRIKKEVVGQAIDEIIAACSNGNGGSQRKRKIKIKPEPVEEENALYDIYVAQSGERNGETCSGGIEVGHGQGAESTSDEREVPETVNVRKQIVEGAKDNHLIVVSRNRGKNLEDTTESTGHAEPGDTGALPVSPVDVAPDIEPTRTNRVNAVSEDIFDELVQDHSRSSNSDTDGAFPEDAVMRFSCQGTPYLEPVFTGPCAEIIDEYGSGSCDGRDYDDLFALGGSLSADLFDHDQIGYLSFEDNVQPCSSALSETKNDSDDNPGIISRHVSPEQRLVPSVLPQPQLQKLIVDSNQPPWNANSESLAAVGESSTEVDVDMTSNNLPDSAIEIELLCNQEVASEHSRNSCSPSTSRRHSENGGSGNEGSTERRASAFPRKSPSPITPQELRKRLIAGKQKAEARNPGIVKETARRRKQQQLSIRTKSQPCAQQRGGLNLVVKFNVEEEILIRTRSHNPQLRQTAREEQAIFARKRRIRKTGYLEIAGHRFTSSKEAYAFCRKKWKEQRRDEM